MSDIQERIVALAKEKGFYSGNQWEKLKDEFDELLDAPSDPEEMSDVLLALLLHADKSGVDLLACATAKMEKVRLREHGTPDERGVIRHLPD